MTQEEQQLLLKDLSGRLSCGVIIQVYFEDISADGYFDEELLSLKLDGESAHVNDRWIENIKPYLRPLSSMTEEEKKHLLVTIVGNDGIKYFQVLPDGSIDNTDDTIQGMDGLNIHWINFNKDTVTLYLDWLNAHHFDYRGLIEKGLALEAPDGMYISTPRK